MPGKVGRPKLDNPKDARVTIRFTQDQLARLEAYAKEAGMDKSKVITKAVEQILDTK